jgi:hypothetical protein
VHKQVGETGNFEANKQYRKGRRFERIRTGKKHLPVAIAILGQGNLDKHNEDPKT